MRLIVETYGAKLSYDSGVVVVEKNNEKEEISLLHITSIHILNQARISATLITQCIKSGIPVYFENDLEVEAMIWTPQFGSISTIRKKQALFSYSPEKYPLIKRLLIRKNEERIKFIKKTTIKPDILQDLNELEVFNNKIARCINNDNHIRSLEANSSKLFYKLYNALLPSSYRFVKRTYRNSKEILNIMLNYAYGILYKYVVKALITAGLDPDTGFFHAGQYNKPALAFDMIEPYRPWAEKNVYKTIKNKEFQKINPVVDQNGKIVKSAKHLLIEEMTQWLSEQKISWNGKIKTPQTHIRLDAHALAQYILKFSEKNLINSICINR